MEDRAKARRAKGYLPLRLVGMLGMLDNVVSNGLGALRLSSRDHVSFVEDTRCIVLLNPNCQSLAGWGRKTLSTVVQR